MISQIHRALVTHRRHWKKEHDFSYPIYVFALDLDELSLLDKNLKLFGYNRFGLASIHDGDYLAVGPGSIRDKLLNLLRTQGVEEENRIGNIVLLTSARFLNYVFNPVSFYFVYSSDERLLCVVAEVNNTFGEKHVYILKNQSNPGEYPARFKAPKGFHVSPFFDLQGEYSFSLADIRKLLDIEVRLFKNGVLAFEAHLEGQGLPLPLNTGGLLSVFVRHPLRATLTFPRILKEATGLYFGKRLTFHPKPEPVSPMTIRRKG